MAMYPVNIRRLLQPTVKLAPLRRHRQETNRRLRELLSPPRRRWSPRIPPEVKAALDIARAVRDGDETRARDLIAAFVRAPMDGVLSGAYGTETWSDLADWEHGILPELISFLRYHRERMSKEPSGWYEERAEYVYSKLHKVKDHHLMRSLERPEENHKQQLERLRREVPGAVMTVESDGYFGSYVVAGVERRIIEDNRLLRDTRKRLDPDWDGGSRHKIVSLPPEDSGLHGERTDNALDSPEEVLLERFAKMERERRRDRVSERFTPAEQMIAEFLRHEYAHVDGGPTPRQAIAQKFGLAPSTARVHVKNLLDKYSA